MYEKIYIIITFFMYNQLVTQKAPLFLWDGGFQTKFEIFFCAFFLIDLFIYS